MTADDDEREPPDPLSVMDVPAVPGERVFHDVRQRWYTVIEYDGSVGQSLVDEDGEKQEWLNNHHLWRTDEE